MAKPKVSSKDLQKTPRQKKENYYPKEQTDLGKNKNQGNTDGSKKIGNIGWPW